MDCRHCKLPIRALKDADTGELTWVHTDIPQYLYVHCRTATAQPTETVGEWADRLFKPRKK